MTDLEKLVEKRAKEHCKGEQFEIGDGGYGHVHDAMRLGSTISPRHADAALAAFPTPTDKT